MMSNLQQVRVFPSQDPRLDWVSKHDARSLNYTADKLTARPVSLEKRPRIWHGGPTIDQTFEGACVGFGWTQELMSSPRPYSNVNAEYASEYARGYYHECLRNDEYAGEADEGTSVLAGAQTAVRRGFLDSFYWCTSVEQIRDCIIQFGPVVIGIPWLESMYAPRSSGLVDINGNIAGGHCILLDEYHPGKRLLHEDYHERFEVFGFHNSWGNDYGIQGRGYIRFEDLRELMRHWGEACVPVGRRLVRF